MRVRIYVPTTMAGLAALVATGRLQGPLRAHAVTPRLREEWPDGGDEEWEYAALAAAADASRGLVGPRGRRCVVAADVADAVPVEGQFAGVEPTLVDVPADVGWKNVASAHVDPAEGAADEDDLAWFATQEIAALVEG